MKKTLTALAEFDQLLREELEKVDRFYADREAELEVRCELVSKESSSFSPLLAAPLSL